MKPASVSPGQSVLIQATDINGKPYSDDSGAVITINGVETTSRYYQFPRPGTMKVTIRAVKDNIDETSVASINVAGAPLTYNREIGPPSRTAMPIIMASLSLGNPYLAAFSLNTPSSVLSEVAPPGKAPTPVPISPVRPAPTIPIVHLPVTASVAPPEESPVSKALSALPANQLTVLPSHTVKTNDGALITGARFGRIAPEAVKFPPVATSYHWDFGDGSTQTTQSPMTTHDYFPAIQADKVSHSFDVSCTIVHDNLTVKRTLVLVSAYGISKQLGTIVPYYTGDEFATFQGIAFSGTMIVRNIENQIITLQQMAIVPVSDDPTILPPAPKFSTMQTPVTIQANSSVALGVYVTETQLGNIGPKTSGFTVYYLGNTSGVKFKNPIIPKQVVSLSSVPSIPGVADPTAPVAAKLGVSAQLPGVKITDTHAVVNDTLPPPVNVRFSHTFRIRLTDSGWNQPAASLAKVVWDHTLVLNGVSSKLSSVKSVILQGKPSIDPATSTIAIPISSKSIDVATQELVGKSIQAGLSGILAKTATLRAISAPPAGAVQAGQVCDPDNISDSDAATAENAGLACQTTKVTETVLIPGSFQNAQKGDVILSPGQDGADNLIGALLRSLVPPQYHSHSGLMTQNYFEITHCTASENRLVASSNLVGFEGIGGIQPNVLEFGWPGSITQTVDNAINGERWNDPIDPSGKTAYIVQGFNPEPLGIENSSNDFVLVYPMVVKPMPENEELARPLLRRAADLARSKGAKVDGSGNLIKQAGAYYCFYAYSNPAISTGFTSPAPASAGWAQGLSPAVCSSFIWLCMKESGINLVGPNPIENQSELSAMAVANGEVIGPDTPDGLFFYSSARRQAAAQILNSVLNNMVMEKEGFAQNLPVVNSAVAQSIANQVLNMFASNKANMNSSLAWQNPGDANAVSPDDILRGWNPICFGYAEQVQYLPAYSEQYIVSRWVQVTTYGVVSGTVTSNGAPVPGANVSLNDMLTTTTDQNGAFTLNKVPVGSYNLKASATVMTNGIDEQMANGLNGPAGQGTPITTTTSNPNQTNLVVPLKPLPPYFRSLAIQGSWKSDHGDLNATHQQGLCPTQGPLTNSISVDPGINGQGTVGTMTPPFSFDYNNQGLFGCNYAFTAALLADLSIQVTINGTLHDDSSQDEQASQTLTFNVPAGSSVGWEMWMQYNGNTYHNGPAYFTGTAANNQLAS